MAVVHEAYLALGARFLAFFAAAVLLSSPASWAIPEDYWETGYWKTCAASASSAACFEHLPVYEIGGLLELAVYSLERTKRSRRQEHSAAKADSDSCLESSAVWPYPKIALLMSLNRLSRQVLPLTEPKRS